MKRTLTILAVVLLGAMLLAADEKDDKKPKTETRAQVSIKSIAFKPASVSIKAGQTVVWTNNDDRDHNVTADDGSWKSDKLGNSETYAHAFPKKGKFSYSCTYHPRMKGVVVVE